MPKRPRFYADPRTNDMAQRLMIGAMEEVAQRMLAGQYHYTAREEVLRELVPAWRQMAGKQAADLAVRGLHFLAPEEYLTRDEARRLKEKRKAEALVSLARFRPEANTRFNRFWIRMTGFAFWGLVALAGAPLADAGRAEARAADGGRLRALAACGRASLGTAEYERRCRAFSRTDRAIVRDYDPPGGALSEWQRPKAWE